MPQPAAAAAINAIEMIRCAMRRAITSPPLSCREGAPRDGARDNLRARVTSGPRGSPPAACCPVAGLCTEFGSVKIGGVGTSVPCALTSVPRALTSVRSRSAIALRRFVADLLERHLVELVDDVRDASPPSPRAGPEWSAVALASATSPPSPGARQGKSRTPRTRLRSAGSPSAAARGPRGPPGSRITFCAWPRNPLGTSSRRTLTPSRCGSKLIVTGTENSRVFKSICARTSATSPIGTPRNSTGAPGASPRTDSLKMSS